MKEEGYILAQFESKISPGNNSLVARQRSSWSRAAVRKQRAMDVRFNSLFPTDLATVPAMFNGIFLGQAFPQRCVSMVILKPDRLTM